MTQTKHFEFVERQIKDKVERRLANLPLSSKECIYVGTPKAKALHNYFEHCSKRLKIGQLINVVFDQKPYSGGQRTHGTYHIDFSFPLDQPLGPLYDHHGLTDWKGTLPITIIPECTMPYSTSYEWVDSSGLTHEGYHPPPQPLLGESWQCQVITYYAYESKEYAVVALRTKIKNAGESI